MPRFKQEKFLKPLVPKRKKTKIATFDIESNEWKNFEMGGFYDGLSYFHFDSLSELVSHCLSYKYRGYRLYAHNGGKFDFLFIAEELSRLNVEFRKIVQGPAITALIVKFSDRHTVSFCDSLKLIPGALGALTKAYGVDNQKLTGAIDFEGGERVDRNNPLHREYLKNDCIGLFQVLRKFEETPGIRETGLKLTTASQSMAVFRTLMKREIRITPQEVQDFVRESYFGGRCEIFRQEARDYTRYDANSLFPTQMRLKKIPLEVLRKASDVDDFGFHDVTVEVPDCHIPILAVKQDMGKARKLIFPTGVFRGKYFSEELKLALKHGARILKYHGGYEFTGSTDFFSEFVDLFYRMRLENPDPSPLNHAAKIILNGNYGKWAMREEMETMLRVDPKNPATWPERFSVWRSEEHFIKTGLVTVSESYRAPFMLCHISAAITAYARIHMAENYYLPYQDELYYTDTDSVDTKYALKTGEALGEIKNEYGTIDYGFYLLPKSYYLRLKKPLIKKGKEIHEIKKIKGFRNSFVKTLTLEDFRGGKIESHERILAAFKTSLIKNGNYLSLVDRKRSIVSGYDKRKMYRDGSTRPWRLEKGVLR